MHCQADVKQLPIFHLMQVLAAHGVTLPSPTQPAAPPAPQPAPEAAAAPAAQPAEASTAGAAQAEGKLH